MTQYPKAGVSDTGDTYHRLRNDGASVHAAATFIEPWLRSNGPAGLMELLWYFAETSSSGDRSDFSRARYAREIHKEVLTGRVAPGLAAAFFEELDEWVECFAVLVERSDDILRRQRGARASAVGSGPGGPPVVRDSRSVIRNVGHRVAVELGIKDEHGS